MNQPEVIGDLIECRVTFTAPTGSDATVTSAQMLTRSPAGVETAVDGTEVSPNVWHFQAANRITEAGTWTVRINANAGLIDSLETRLNITRSQFTDPLPT